MMRWCGSNVTDENSITLHCGVDKHLETVELELWRAHTPRPVTMFMYEVHSMGCTFVTYAHVHKAHGQP